ASGRKKPPRAVDAVGVERRLGGRPEPQVEVDVRGWRGRLDVAEVAPQLTVPRLHREDLADRAALDPVHRLADGLGAARLRADLDDDLVAGGLDHQPALADVVAARLLDVDVLAGVGGEDRGG